jgi:hypothetical protein
MFWWNGGPRFGNFGDQLSPLLCERLSGKKAVHRPIPEAGLVGIGSLLEDRWANGAWSEYEGTIWGSGRMYGEQPLDLSRARIRALRGRLSLESIVHPRKKDVVLGDPGLLAHQLAPAVPKRIKLGIIPHWTQRGEPIAGMPTLRAEGAVAIDICARPAAVIAVVAQCQFIISSALHGLILADAMKIPNKWLKFNTGREYSHGFPDFKYRDYYSVFGIHDPEPISLRPGDSVDSIVKRIGDYDRPGLEDIQAALVESFPRDL